MDESVEELQSSLLGIYKNVLMHEHFFDTIAGAYEAAVLRPMSTFPLLPMPAEVVYRTKQKAKGKAVAAGREEEEEKERIRIPKAFGIVANSPLLTRIKSSQPDFRHIVSDFKSRIHSAKQDSQASKARFLSALRSRSRPSRPSPPWDLPASKGLSCYLMLDQMTRLLGSTEFMKPVLAAIVAEDQSYYTLEEAVVVLRSMMFLMWIEKELPRIREDMREDVLPGIIEKVKGEISTSGSSSKQLFDDFKGENRLLARIKTCKTEEDFSSVYSEYCRFSLWHAQAEVLKYLKTRFSSEPPSVPVLRALLSIVQRGGKRICTVLRETK